MEECWFGGMAIGPSVVSNLLTRGTLPATAVGLCAASLGFCAQRTSHHSVARPRVPTARARPLPLWGLIAWY